MFVKFVATDTIAMILSVLSTFIFFLLFSTIYLASNPLALLPAGGNPLARTPWQGNDRTSPHYAVVLQQGDTSTDKTPQNWSLPEMDRVGGVLPGARDGPSSPQL